MAIGLDDDWRAGARLRKAADAAWGRAYRVHGKDPAKAVKLWQKCCECNRAAAAVYHRLKTGTKDKVGKHYYQGHVDHHEFRMVLARKFASCAKGDGLTVRVARS